jgi:hypothetical protein
MLFQSEFQMLLNSKYRSGIKLGMETTILNRFSIRAGWYNEKVDNFGFPAENKNQIKDFTYGLGLQMPLSSFTKIPINIQFDYTSLPQVSYSKTRTEWNNFRTFSLSINYH